MTEIIAERELLAKSPKGDLFRTIIRFGRPYERERYEWHCDLAMEGIDKVRYGIGVDSLQAMVLTLVLAESILVSRLESGWQFFWPDTEEPMTIGEMFKPDNYANIVKAFHK